MYPHTMFGIFYKSKAHKSRLATMERQMKLMEPPQLPAGEPPHEQVGQQHQTMNQ